MDRRKFVRGAGLATGVLGGFFAGKEVVERIHTKEIIMEVSKPVEDISHLKPPESINYLSLQGAYGKDEEKPSDNPFMITNTNTKVTHRVDMTVGLDNRLWIKVNGEWKRVVVEG